MRRAAQILCLGAFGWELGQGLLAASKPSDGGLILFNVGGALGGVVLALTALVVGALSWRAAARRGDTTSADKGLVALAALSALASPAVVLGSVAGGAWH